MKDPAGFESFVDVSVNYVRGKPPVFRIYDEGVVVDTVALSSMDRTLIEAMLAEKGFAREDNSILPHDEPLETKKRGNPTRPKKEAKIPPKESSSEGPATPKKATPPPPIRKPAAVGEGSKRVMLRRRASAACNENNATCYFCIGSNSIVKFYERANMQRAKREGIKCLRSSSLRSLSAQRGV